MQLSDQLEETHLRELYNACLPEKIGFGDLMLPIMTRTRYRAGQWQATELLPYQDIALSPSCKGLHYGQVIFEGLKAYANLQTGGALVFCLKRHWQRLNRSAARLAMPEVPETLFAQAIEALVSRASTFIPQKSGDALYIRPFMYASAPGLGLAKNDDFDLYIIASPSEAYFTEPLDVMIERDQHRAFSGGTGMIKMAGNYAQTFVAGHKAKEAGCGLSLWLDGETGKYVEEFSAMNFFALRDHALRDNATRDHTKRGQALYTPPLKGTILPGVTRAAVIELAKVRGIDVIEEDIAIDELLLEIEQGRCQEVFATGTGATITPIRQLKEQNGASYRLPGWELSMLLKDDLQQIHHGLRSAPRPDWCTTVKFVGAWI